MISLPLSGIIRVAQVWMLYDGAPEVARKLFASVADDPQLLREKMDEEFQRATTDIARRSIGVAYNFASIEANFGSDPEEAIDTIQVIVEREAPVSILNQYLELMDSTYAEECEQQQRLLSPRDLDRILFERFAPRSADLATTYLDGDALLIARQIGENHYACVSSVIAKQLRAAASVELAPGQTTTLALRRRGHVVNKHSYHVPEHELEPRAREELHDKYGVDDLRVVCIDQERMTHYLIGRHQVMGVARALPEAVLSAGLPPPSLQKV